MFIALLPLLKTSKGTYIMVCRTQNATVVFGDVDLATTVPQIVRAAFTNNGQVI